MKVTAGIILCGIGVAGIVITVVALIATIPLFSKQRKKLLSQIENE